jgi:hypothetical protein
VLLMTNWQGLSLKVQGGGIRYSAASESWPS